MEDTTQQPNRAYHGPNATVNWSNNASKAGGGEPQNQQYQFRASQSNSGGQNKLRQAIRCSKRRIIQQVLVKLNQAEVSADSEYQMLRDRQLEFQAHVEDLIVQIKSFAANMVAMGHGATTIGDVATKISIPPPASNSRNMSIAETHGTGFDTGFPRAMCKVDSSGRELAGSLLNTVVASLEKKLQALITLKKEMEDRENLKLDFDSAVRKLRNAKEKGRREDVVRRDVKLQAARSALAQATDAIIKKFTFYEGARGTFIYHELQQFRELQTKFFALCVSSFQVHEHHDLRDEDFSSDLSSNQHMY
ncbi:hypothetical protein Poli38472_009238 [Pythium oligandrum]|uniref:BAR domain-containing protein n=1 Tax=Pythium oligandrum TaxID=41045 RepID=A0A8K1FJL9_PYTOL|nr:hypothetical protein Poli38472_009238 [Pythium oligandrum]|eukprot:TMW65071.1 hypothetical protein Poli38472_009238 [Pythium oligandrum]